ncbi:MAG: tRNA pseudouridine(54/55) synthase Pus10 [Thermoplasmatota archaeon]
MNTKSISSAKKVIESYDLCDSCLGRLFSDVHKGISNKEKGVLIRRKLNCISEVSVKKCWLCEGLTGEIKHFVDLVTEKIQDYEFTSFLIGSIIDEEIVQKEHELWNFINIDSSEPIKMQINREVGKILEALLKRIVEFNNPDITSIIDTAYDEITLEVRSLYIYGRYKKFKRGIPQTKWPCMICRGKGCSSCQYSGRMYESSVEELIAHCVLEYTKGTDESFHGCGREDIDALMLGGGRPFVLEIKNPKIRTINFSELSLEINSYAEKKIEVCDLRVSDKKEITRLKDSDFHKVYMATIKGEKLFNKEKLKEVAEILPSLTIKQLTPVRVAHRRANKIREKKIYNCKLESVEGSIAKLIIEAQSGTYIKELVSGDSGRTTPNISDIIGIPCKVEELDVIEIKGE